MKAIRITRLKLLSNDQEYFKIATAYREAANWLSSVIFMLNRVPSAAQLSRKLYGEVRNRFKLPSQVTCSLFRQLVATYKTMRSNKNWSLAKFRKLDIPVCWRRDFSVTRKSPLRIWGKPVNFQSGRIPDGLWRDSRLKYCGKHWYLLLAVQVDIPNPKTTGVTIGVDCGINNMLVAVHKESNKTLYISGSILNHRRHCIRQVRATVASVGTRSAKRLLKRLAGKEKSVTQQLIHCASKQLVEFADSVGANRIVMENLTHIRRRGKKLSRWPFRQCQFCIHYKAASKAIDVRYVSPAYTSQTCPACFHICAGSRKDTLFRCLECNFSDHADRVASNNIRQSFDGELSRDERRSIRL